MNFVCIVFELVNNMLRLSSMENIIVQCNLMGMMRLTLSLFFAYDFDY